MEGRARRVVGIDRAACNGCGLCVTACHEGAIALVDGKAQLVREQCCDGLGDCLPACPVGAIAFEERVAMPYDEAAARRAAGVSGAHAASGADGGAPVGMGAAPGAGAPPAAEPEAPAPIPGAIPAPAAPGVGAADAAGGPASGPKGAFASQLAQWPCQIKLASPGAACFQGADLLVAADCTAFAYAAFHRDFMAGKVTLVGCPKLDGVDYAGKLGAILAEGGVRSVTVARMTVPCCGGLERAAREAVAASGLGIPVAVRTIGTDGSLQ